MEMNRYRTILTRLLGMLLALPQRASRYDFVLVAIPAAFLFSGLLRSALAIDSVTALTAASVLSTIAVLDALFLNPPKGPTTGTRPA